jgi:hypothetical protein
MSSGRTTHDKRQRERAKQAKQAEKRARRQERNESGGVGIGVEVEDDARSTEQLLAEMEELHAAYDANQIDLDTFDERKNDLMDRIALRLAEGG